MNADIQELAQRALAELEEFWRENVFALLNTIVDPQSDFSQVAEFQASLKELVDKKFIIINFREINGKPEKKDEAESRSIADNLQEWFRFDESRAVWTLRNGDIKSARIPQTILTPLGREKARAILTERGYQWWRPRRR